MPVRSPCSSLSGDRDQKCRTTRTARTAYLQELLLELKVLDKLPDARPHRDPCAELGKGVRGLVDVDFNVRGVLLEEEGEEETSQACAAVDRRKLAIASENKHHSRYHIHNSDAELGRAVEGHVVCVAKREVTVRLVTGGEYCWGANCVVLPS